MILFGLYAAIAVACLIAAALGDLGSSFVLHELWARGVFGIIGSLFAYPLVRRVALGEPFPGRKPSPNEIESEDFRAKARRVKIAGRVLFVIATWLFFLGVSPGTLEDAIEIGPGWPRPVLIGLGVVLFVFGLAFQIDPKSVARSQRRGELDNAHARRGRATIKEIRDTGWTINQSPRFELDLEIALEGRTPYPTTFVGIVPRIALGRIEPGAEIPVKVHPDDQSIYELDWGKP